MEISPSKLYLRAIIGSEQILDGQGYSDFSTAVAIFTIFKSLGVPISNLKIFAPDHFYDGFQNNEYVYYEHLIKKDQDLLQFSHEFYELPIPEKTVIFNKLDYSNLDYSQPSDSISYFFLLDHGSKLGFGMDPKHYLAILASILDFCQSKDIFIINDCCYSGLLIDTAKFIFDFEKNISPFGFLSSFEKQSVFMFHLLLSNTKQTPNYLIDKLSSKDQIISYPQLKDLSLNPYFYECCKMLSNDCFKDLEDLSKVPDYFHSANPKVVRRLLKPFEKIPGFNMTNLFQYFHDVLFKIFRDKVTCQVYSTIQSLLDSFTNSSPELFTKSFHNDDFLKRLSEYIKSDAFKNNSNFVNTKKHTLLSPQTIIPSFDTISKRITCISLATSDTMTSYSASHSVPVRGIDTVLYVPASSPSDSAIIDILFIHPSPHGITNDELHKIQEKFPDEPPALLQKNQEFIPFSIYSINSKGQRLPEDYKTNELPIISFNKRYPSSQNEHPPNPGLVRENSTENIVTVLPPLKPHMKKYKSFNDGFTELSHSHFDDGHSNENEEYSDYSDISTFEYYSDEDEDEDEGKDKDKDDTCPKYKIRFNLKTEFRPKLLKEKDEDEELYDSYLSENQRTYYAREIRVFRDFCIIFKTLLKENHLTPFRIGHPGQPTFAYNQILYLLYLESNRYYYNIATNVLFNHYMDDILGYLQTNSEHIEKILLLFISSLIILNKVFPSEFPPKKTTLYEFDRHQFDKWLIHI